MPSVIGRIRSIMPYLGAAIVAAAAIAETSGAAVDEGEATEGTSITLVYSNTLGQSVFGPPASLPTARIADDIATTAVADCNLDHYVVRVSGDRDGDGSGVGPFSVNAALYQTCPGAGDATPIPDTECHADLPDNGVHSVTCQIPAYVHVPIPASLYLGVSFSRLNCGVVVGAPALVGFSDDTFDLPGFPCSGSLGGFPDYPHASFYAEIYVRDECPSAFPGYRASNGAGPDFTLGAEIRFADDIHLGVPECNMVAYEVGVNGWHFQFDLRTFLSDTDPENGGVIPGTEGAVLFELPVRNLRIDVDPPIPLPQDFWITFKTSDPVRVAGRPASLGFSENFYAWFNGSEWVTGPFPGQTYAAFDVTIWCEGVPAIGACCDMILTDEDGEAVCRELPEMNCGFPQLWREGKSCESVCEGGENDGQPCTRQADCPGYNCAGGPNDGNPCEPGDPNDCPQSYCKRAECPGPFPHPCGQSACCAYGEDGVFRCSDLTENECYEHPPVDRPRLFERGEYCYEGGFSCPWGACLDREGECTRPRDRLCAGGPHDGDVCVINRDCGVCVGGSNNGDPCNILLPPETECPNGYCDGFCEPQRGCGDPWCCTAVCDLWDYYCCIVEWDAQCAAKAFVLCNTPPANDHCWSPDPIKGARLVYIPSITEGDALHATEDLTDPGFCCHGGVHCPGGMCCHAGNEDCYASQYGLCVDGERDGKPCDREASGDVGPGSPGYGTVWYKFVAPDTSVELLTCNSSNLPRVNDSVISVYVPAEPDRGICDDLSICSVSTQDCFDGSPCILDERHACEHLLLIGCSDDVEYCSPNDANARLCVTDLEIGQTYYVLVGAKIDLIPDSPYYDRVTFNLEVYADCTPPEPPMPNDFCQNATPLAGDDLDVAFDLSGGDEYAPATFHCPGEPGCPVLLNDVWYDWVAPARGEATITTCDENLPPQDQPNTTLCVYDGCNCPLEIGTLIGECNFGTFDECGLSGTVTFDAVSGECYKIRLGGHMGDTPAGELSISLSGAFPDCNGNGVPDDEDIASGTSEDCDSDGTPDECETDSDGDGTIDDCDGCPDDPNKIHPGVCGCGVAYCQIPFKGEVVKSSPEPGEPGRGVPRGASTIPPKE